MNSKNLNSQEPHFVCCTCGSRALRPSRYCSACTATDGEWTLVHPKTSKVYLVATGEVHNGRETYTRHDERPPLCEAEVLLSPSTGNTCTNCGKSVTKVNNQWVSSTDTVLPQYCFADPVLGSKLHEVSAPDREEALVAELASILGSQDEFNRCVYATEFNGKAYAVTVETAERFNRAIPDVPVEGSLEADAAIKEMLKERGWPSSSMNAARAGWRAALMYPTEPEGLDQLAGAVKTKGE